MTRLIAGGFVVIVLIETVAFVVDPRAALPAAGAALAGFALLAAGRLAGAQTAPAAASRGSAAEESLRRWRAQTETLIAWADSTRGDWDRHLRPRLAREYLMATGQQESAAQRETGLMVFGEDLWPWVDPRNIPRTDRDAPGPGRSALQEILRRLEQI